MSESSHDDFRAIWRELSRRNGWALVEDEAAFLDEAIVEFEALRGDGAPDGRRRLALTRAYSRRLYRALWRRQERAAAELAEGFRRMALASGSSEFDAQDQSQETVTRVLKNLPSLRAPESLVTWATLIFRTVMRDSRKQTQLDEPYSTSDYNVALEPRAPGDMATEVVDDLLVRQMLASLPDTLDREVLWRSIVHKEKPSDIARDLGLDPAFVRMRKNRALGRLRESVVFVGASDRSVDEGAPETGSARSTRR